MKRLLSLFLAFLCAFSVVSDAALRHKFVNPQTDLGNPNETGPNEWNDDHTINTTAGTPAANEITLINRPGANDELGYVDSRGFQIELQSDIVDHAGGIVMPLGNSTTLHSFGANFTATGTATAANVATTSKHTSLLRLDYLVTTAAATAVAGLRHAATQTYLSNAAGRGGFYFKHRWAPATGGTVTTNRSFIGIRASSAAPTDVEPSTLVSMIGFAWDAADTNIQFMRNDGIGTATKIDLGASFPVPTTDRPAPYEVEIAALPNTTVVYYAIKNLDTGTTASGSVNSDLPAVNTLLAWNSYISVGGTSSVVGYTFFGHEQRLGM